MHSSSSDRTDGIKQTDGGQIQSGRGPIVGGLRALPSSPPLARRETRRENKYENETERKYNRIRRRRPPPTPFRRRCRCRRAADKGSHRRRRVRGGSRRRSIRTVRNARGAPVCVRARAPCRRKTITTIRTIRTGRRLPFPFVRRFPVRFIYSGRRGKRGDGA